MTGLWTHAVVALGLVVVPDERGSLNDTGRGVGFQARSRIEHIWPAAAPLRARLWSPACFIHTSASQVALRVCVGCGVVCVHFNVFVGLMC